MTNINLIVVAMKEELNRALIRIDNYKTINLDNTLAYEFNYHNNNYLLVEGKIGKASTAFFIGQLSKMFNIVKIYNIGTSGGYSPKVKINDVVIASEVGYFDVNVTAFGYEFGQIASCPRFFTPESNFDLSSDEYNIHIGLIGTSDSFITKENQSNYQLDKMNPLCVEMESASVCQCAYLLNIPCVIIRSISDHINLGNNSSDNVNNLDISCDHCVDTLFKIID